MRILLMRHGQTDLNVQKRLQGSSEIPLNEQGKEQAREAHAWLKEQELIPTKIISSPLGRAIETGQLAAGWTDHSNIEVYPDLIEMSFGIYEQQNMEEVDPNFLSTCFDHPETYVAPKGGESFDEVVLRAGHVVEMLRNRIAAGAITSDDTVLLVSHGALGHAILEYISKTPRSAYWDVDINNCAVVELLIGSTRVDDRYKFLNNGFEKNW